MKYTAAPAPFFSDSRGRRLSDTPRTFFARTLDESAICEFSDGSWVDAWDLFHACVHAP